MLVLIVLVHSALMNYPAVNKIILTQVIVLVVNSWFVFLLAKAIALVKTTV